METERRILTREAFDSLLQKAVAAGQRAYGPKDLDGRIDFAPIARLDDLSTGHVQTTQSAKFALFPKVEELFSFHREGNAQVLDEATEADTPETLLLGVRPCDAAAIASLAAIFNWDTRDPQFNRRLARTTVVTITCTHADEYCFCTSVGGGPGNSTGSDLLLTPLEGGTYLAEVLTARGQALLALVPESSTPANAVDKESRLACVPSRFTAETVTAKMAVAFDREGLWREQSLRCLGCGACAFVCPTCACFDISDESNGIQGKRLRTWDSCGFSLFTKHTSGHNPREVQSQRWRQRLMHKFVYMPDRLKVLGCVGCGRCSRSCPVDMNILEHVTKVAEVK